MRSNPCSRVSNIGRDSSHVRKGRGAAEDDGTLESTNENLRSRWRDEPHIANEGPQTEKDSIKVEVEAITVLSALAQDPER